MLDHLQGVVTAAEPTRVVLRAAGLGLELLVPLGTADALSVGGEATLYTHLHISDSPRLLGFATREERDFCRQLLRVNGVGPAIAVAILSGTDPGGLRRALAEGDEKTLTAIKGVGRKTAQRILLDLAGTAPVLPDHERPPTDVEEADAVAALIALGYKEKEARAAVTRARERRPDADAGELIRTALSG